MGKHIIFPGAEPPPLRDGYVRMDYVDISAETEKAYLFQLEDKAVWIPRVTMQVAPGFLPGRCQRMVLR